MEDNYAEGLYDISAEFEIGSAERFGFFINNIQITYEIKEQKLYCQKHCVSLKPMEGKINFRILVDRTTLELFANDGRIYMPIRTHIDITEISELYSKFGIDFNITKIAEFYPFKVNYAVPYTKPVDLGKGDIKVFSEGGKTKLTKIEIHGLNSIWQ